MSEVLEKKISIKDACNLIGKAKDVFAPIKEAVTNSLDAIIQRQETKETFQPKIIISFHYKTKIDLLHNKEIFLDAVSIEDNGMGFTSKNLYNFKQFASPAKGLNNRGTGIIQIFCRFDKLNVESLFSEDNKDNEYKASWDIIGNYEEQFNKEVSFSDNKTKITMSCFSGNEDDRKFYERYLGDLDELKKDTIANLYQELLPLSELARRASIRNKSFAEKLGVSSPDNSSKTPN